MNRVRMPSPGHRIRDACLLAVSMAVCLVIPNQLLHAQSVLEIPPPARASGMGLAHVAVVSGADAAWWNPAALGFAGWSHSATGTYRRVQLLDPGAFGYLFLGYATQIEGAGTIAADLAYISYGTQLHTDFSGQLLGEYTPYMLAPAAAFGGKVFADLSLGVGFKVIHAFYFPSEAEVAGEYNASATSVALDGGLLWSGHSQPVSVGLAVQNLGPGLEFAEGESDPLPRSLRAGVGYQAVSTADHALLLAGDLDKPLVNWDDGPKLNLGMEYLFRSTLAVRFGWIYEGWYQDIDPINDPTLGFGVRIGWFAFDYASVPLDTETRNWLITFGATF